MTNREIAIEGYELALKLAWDSDGPFPMGKIKFIKRQIFLTQNSNKKTYRYKK